MTAFVRPLAFAALLLVVACGGLPRHFDAMTLDGKIQAYSQHLAR